MEKQYVVGHRGAKGIASENTLSSFKLGLEYGADLVECDIHLSKDKHLIVFHDSTLDRMTNGTGWLRDYSLKELLEFDVEGNAKIPTLEDILTLVLDADKKLIIEIKGESKEIAVETAKVLSEFLKEKDCLSKVAIHSFWSPAILKVKELLPEAETILVFWAGLEEEQIVDIVLSSKANGISIEYEYVSKKLVELLHERGLTIDVFLLNNDTLFQSIKEKGVNGLITDYPNKFKL